MDTRALKQACEHALLKGTGFSPYIETSEGLRLLPPGECEAEIAAA
jgi:hypothetical protein